MPNATSQTDSKRDLILRAAGKLIRHYGYAKTTIRDIAANAGLGKGTVYLYFESKTDIMLALVDLTNENIARDLEEIAAREASPEKRLRDCLLHRVMTIFDLVHRYPHGEDFISSMKPEIVKRIDRYVKKQGAILGRIVSEGCEAGTFKSVDARGAGLMLASLFEFFTPPYYRFRSRKALESFANSVLDLFLEGLRAPEHVPARCKRRKHG